MGDLFNSILIYPIINVLVAIYHGLSFLHVPFALGFSIIVLTALLRLILYPLTASQLRASKKMQDLNPHIRSLREKHKGDSKRLQQETMKLYKEHGINPAAGCLPLIVQLPFIWGLYTVLNSIVQLDSKSIVSYVNNIVYSPSLNLSSAWDTSFFGLPLGQSPSQLMNSFGYLIILIPLVTALLQFIQSKMLFASVPGKKDKKQKDDFATAFQAQSVYIFPLMIGFFSFGFPVGLSLYWNTFTVFGIIQQYQIQGLGGLKPWIDKIRGKVTNG